MFKRQETSDTPCHTHTLLRYFAYIKSCHFFSLDTLQWLSIHQGLDPDRLSRRILTLLTPLTLAPFIPLT